MEKKILSELFECEGDQELFNSILNNAPGFLDMTEQELIKLLDKPDNDTEPSKALITPLVKQKSSSSNNINITSVLEDKKPMRIEKAGSPNRKNKLLPKVYLKVNTNIVNNNSAGRINTTSSNNVSECNESKFLDKKNVVPFDSKQTSLLFKGFLFNEELQDCTEKLQKGLYCDDFYQNTYNKYNNLEQRLAWKRKKVCKKLLHILKILVN
jgi:hypothetical protein